MRWSLIIFLLGMHEIDSQLTFEGTESTEELVGVVRLSCFVLKTKIFNHNVTRITIIKDNVLLGSVSTGEFPLVNETVFDIQAVGQVDSNIKISFLSLTIRRPTMTAHGLYTCQSAFTRNWGGKEWTFSTIHVTIKKLDNLSTYLGEQLLRLDNLLKQQNTQLLILQEEVKKLKSGQIRVESGVYSVGNNIRKFPTNLGSSHAAEDVMVKFMSSFALTPTVVQEVVYWDIDTDQDLKLRIEKYNVTKFGFVGRVRKWAWTCKNMQWIPETQRCDGEIQCKDGSDEEDCAGVDRVCEFEDGLCGWRLDQDDAGRIEHTSDKTGKHLLLLATNEVELQSPNVTTNNQNQCLGFSYYISNGHSLEVYVRLDNHTTNDARNGTTNGTIHGTTNGTINGTTNSTVRIFLSSSRHTGEWRKTNILIPNEQDNFQIIFRARSDTKSGHIGVDDIFIYNCSQSCYDDPLFLHHNMSCLDIFKSKIKLCLEWNVSTSCCSTCYEEFHNKTPTQQCQMNFKTNSLWRMKTSSVDIHTNPSLICHALSCTVDDSIAKMRAVPGTPCGHGKFCIRGKCTTHTLVANVSDYCFYGDDEIFTYKNISCKDVNKGKYKYCYMMKFRINCCKTCQQVHLQLLDAVDMPGHTYSLERQCSLMNKENSTFCWDNLTFVSSICTSMFCRDPGSDNCETYIAAYGTTCGQNMICNKGVCQKVILISDDSNHVHYIIGILMCILFSIALLMALHIFVWNENKKRSSADFFVYEDLDTGCDYIHLKRLVENVGAGEDQYVYPDGGIELLPYNDSSNKLSDASEESTRRNNTSFDDPVNNKVQPVSMPCGMYRNTYDCPMVPDDYKTHYRTYMTVQKSFSDYVCPVDYIYTEGTQRQLHLFSSQTKYDSSRSKSWPLSKEHAMKVKSKILKHRKSSKSCVLKACDKHKKCKQKMSTGIERMTSAYVTPVDVVYPPTDNINTVDGFHTAEDNYITPVDVIYPM